MTPLSCSLVGPTQRVRLVDGSRAATLYSASETDEPYFCNYGVNPAYRERLERGGLRVSGVDEDDEIRIVELPEHPFFVATLFVPQARSTAAAQHPLVEGFVQEASAAVSA